MKLKCPICGGERIFVSQTLYPEDYTGTSDGAVTDFECMACGYKSQNQAEFEEQVKKPEDEKHV